MLINPRRAWRDMFRRPLGRLQAKEERRSPDGEDHRLCLESGLFDAAWYVSRNPWVAAACADPLHHYLERGAALGLDPNPLFASGWYMAENLDVVCARMNPLVHYIRDGSRERRDPGPLFDSRWYLERNPDVAEAGIDPLLHYLRWGAKEGRIRRPRMRRLYPRPSSPTVSAIVPCWNGERWLAEALASIISQTSPVHEIIVVDDASTDGSAAVARRFAATVLRNETNRGEGHSRNVGLRHASGDLVAWLDADDAWLPTHVETLTNLLQSHPEAIGAFAAVQRFGLRKELIRGHVPLGAPSQVYWPALRDWLHTTIGSMVSREALLDLGGFDERERFSVDFDLWVRLSRCHLLVCTHEVTSMWRWHEAQQSAQVAEQVRALYRYRRGYWEQEMSVGDVTFAGVLAGRISEIWREDRAGAIARGDQLMVGVLDEIVPLLPGLIRLGFREVI